MRVLRFLAAILVAVAAIACSEATNSTGSISKRIGEEARAAGTAEVDLGKLTSFGWDRFFVFKPGTTREEVCKFIGANRNVCGRVVRIERAPDDHMFLVFALGGQLTHLELHAVANGQFDFAIPESGLPRSAAVFKVRRSSSGTSEIIWLEPK